ncbi:transglutaminase-like domain-containing protein, partial [Saccharomonospora iraqiensis]|uniref:transglutaminase-like domain-containing protein n=1 Tax=Saccharomonospora iraqiensis TaxID=52698 RepID=UPI00022DF18C
AAVVAGLVAGSTVTAVGTEGSLPGEGAGRDVPGGLGVNPFTSLRGMLDRSGDVELFRVRGLGDEKRLLRAFTLDTYRPNEGWGLADGPMPAGVRADGALPTAPGDDGSAPHRTLRIDPVNWNDVWLPVYGSPRRLSGVADGWFYDRASGAVFRERRTRPEPYTEVAALERPTEEELRAAGTAAGDVADVYVDDSGVDPRVRGLARRLTGSEDTVFDKVEAVWRHFRPGNGFVYDTETAPATDRDALADFLFNGRRGYCEQFASSMAVLLRTLDIPSRVAVGFTSGYRDGNVRTITSRDAHAWVEVYFDGIGWVTFDPTPLSDGRGSVPPYLRSESDVEDTVGPDEPDTTTSATAAPPSAGVDDPGDTATAGGGPEPGTGPWLGRVAA